MTDLRNVSASVVVHRTSEKLLRGVVDSLHRDGVDRVWVIDNSPTSDLREVAEELGCMYEHVENRGYGAAHNVALRKAMDEGGVYHLVVNPDVRWERGVMPYLIDYFDRHVRAGQLMPLTRYPDGRLQHTCRLLPTPWDLICRRFLPKGLCKGRMERYLLPEAAYRREINSPYLLGSFMFFRLDALRSEGLFDERFFMYPEDIDITRRLHAKWDTMMLPEVEIIHDHAAASRHSWRMLWVHVVNMIRYFNKWGWWRDEERRIMNRRLLESLKG